MCPGTWKLSEECGVEKKRQVAEQLRSYITAHGNAPEHAAAIAETLNACRIFLRERVAVEPLMNTEVG